MVVQYHSVEVEDPSVDREFIFLCETAVVIGGINIGYDPDETEEEKRAAEASKDKLGKSGKFQKPIVTEILPTKPFYPAEDYHQRYYQKNPAAYEAYHIGSGRVSYLAKIWEK